MEKRTSAAKAGHGVSFYGTAEAVPFQDRVLRTDSSAPEEIGNPAELLQIGHLWLSIGIMFIDWFFPPTLRPEALFDDVSDPSPLPLPHRCHPG